MRLPDGALCAGIEIGLPLFFVVFSSVRRQRFSLRDLEFQTPDLRCK